MLGTPDYIAPEQISDARRADIRADIYSLGCTLYYLLTGGPPFQGDSLYDILQAHHSMDATPLNLVRPEVPVELAALVAKMMAKEPSRRFQEPKEVAQALKPFFKAGNVASVGSRPEVSQGGPPEARSRTTGAGPIPIQPAPGMASAPASAVKKPPQTARPEPTWDSLVNLRETEPVEDAIPAVAQTKWKRTWTFWPVIVVASMFGVAALGVVLYLATNKGRIKIEVNDPAVVVTIDDRETFSVEGLGEPIRLSVGDHVLKVKRGDLVVKTRSFSVRRRENESLRVEFEPKERISSGGVTDSDGPEGSKPTGGEVPGALPGAAKSIGGTPPVPPAGSAVERSTSAPVVKRGTAPAPPPSELAEKMALPPNRLVQGTARVPIAPPRRITNSIRMNLVLIPAGEFLMGSPDSDMDAFDVEKPQHPVLITRPFYLGTTEVTQGQYRAVTGVNPSKYTGSDDLPVENVSWTDAIVFCNKLSAKEGLKPYYQPRRV